MKRNKNKMRLLTYGSASLHQLRSKNPFVWRESCWEYSEKQDCQFVEILGDVYCAFIDDGIPRIERVGIPAGNPVRLVIVKLDLNELTFEIDYHTYKNDPAGLIKAKMDFKSGSLSGSYLANIQNLW